MKFVDEATIHVQAGKGGNGCLSFRRERYVPRGGPNGGDGGDGGSVFMIADQGINTLVDFRYQRRFQGKNGRAGGGKNCRGRSGDDCEIKVPLGTCIFDEDTDEVIGEMLVPDQRIKVAQGGFHGLGNTRYKSSINRTPRQTSKGSPGEHRNLRLELKVLADVGLLGMPNAGKSTLIRAVSAATPKVADYPFTTLYPSLGVVRVEAYRSFVIADIPGLIPGAAQGAGLGVQFLRHLSRTQLLLHLVDVSPIDESDPVASVDAIYQELIDFDQTLAEKPRWLILNKIDLLPEDTVDEQCNRIVDALKWQGPVFRISAINKLGTDALCQALMRTIEDTE